MKTLKLMLSLVCAALLLTSVQAFGQNKKNKSDIMPPVKADNFKEIAANLTNDGWKTAEFTIEDQMVSTAKMKAEMSAMSRDAQYLWVMEETTAADLAAGKEANHINAVNKLTYQIELPYLSQCQVILVRKGMGDKIQLVNKIIRQITPMVIQNNLLKTMEIYREKDNSCKVQTVYMIHKDKIYDMIMDECIKQVKDDKENAALMDFFRESKARMEKKDLF